jgi:energy-converting hydrogenase Eha subunit E
LDKGLEALITFTSCTTLATALITQAVIIRERKNSGILAETS